MCAGLIVISCNQDGDHLYSTTEEVFLKYLNEGNYGHNPRFLGPFPTFGSTDLDSEVGYIVIRGEVVRPKPKEVVLKYEL